LKELLKQTYGHVFEVKLIEEIALNTSRVFISRILKALENQVRIKLHRNSVEIVI
jgi:hypothetical protein